MENVQLILLFKSKLILKQIVLIDSLLVLFLIFFKYISIRNLNYTIEKLRK